ncbi:hypothetical protein C8F04DRAFT_1174783 [Mycena alexandri]|uniref:Uncharacterized protein n=1 Tax=Mycena alexandri TaxID=1745969 RepID=A0AAD6TFD8_9AGAR|nr:hypothetical protein C8F04DRAFT_1174783 [Mycena alexandri]
MDPSQISKSLKAGMSHFHGIVISQLAYLILGLRNAGVIHETGKADIDEMKNRWLKVLINSLDTTHELKQMWFKGNFGGLSAKNTGQSDPEDWRRFRISITGNQHAVRNMWRRAWRRVWRWKELSRDTEEAEKQYI